MNTSPTISSIQRAHPNATLQNEKGEKNISNEWRTYAKMECNHHLANKFALFYNMNNYYLSMGRDPFDVLPLTFHVGQGQYDPQFFKFQKVFNEMLALATSEKEVESRLSNKTSQDNGS